jgi:DNA-binding Lrp family transcriptional regulator
MQLDAIDLKILAILQSDARISNQDLADRVGLSPSPCLRRVKALESAGVVQRYVALLDPTLIDQSFQAVVEVRLDRQTTDSVSRFEKEILKYPQVLECDLLAGDWDYALRGRIPGVDNVKSNICMKRVKYSTALPLA